MNRQNKSLKGTEVLKKKIALLLFHPYAENQLDFIQMNEN